MDLRWRISPSEISRLRQTQLELLKFTAPKLKPGGILVYSTCSLETEENSKVAEEFLATHPAFKLRRQRAVTPWGDGVDGAYVASFRRTS